MLDGPAHRPCGRPTKYTPERKKKLLEAIAEGNFLETAAALAGVHHDTVAEWVKRSRAGDDVFSAFSGELDAALAKGEAKNVSVVQRVAIGGTERVKTTTKESNLRLPDGTETDTTVIETTTTITKDAPNWQAAAWMLARRAPNRWGDRNKGALDQGQDDTPTGIEFTIVVSAERKVIQPNDGEGSDDN